MKFKKNKHAAAMPHCPQNKRNIGIKSEPVIDGVDATVYTVQYMSGFSARRMPLNPLYRLGF